MAVSGADHSRFAVFILTHGRPDHVITVGALARSGYTGRTYFIIDNEDARGGEYRERYGPDNVIEFDKAAVAETFDTADTQQDRRAVVYARNASYAIARHLGLDYFLQLDDDYTWFRHSWLDPAAGTLPASRVPVEMVKSTFVRSMDAAVEAMLTFLDDTGATTVAFSQGGDHLGGSLLRYRRGLRRKAMNSFFCRTDQPIGFIGRINDDVNAYVVHGSRGALFLTVLALQLNQLSTQQNPGGMSDTYADTGTYLKSFYTVLMAPSCVRVELMHTTHRRWHHHITWEHAVPMILSPSHRKPVP